MKKIQVSFRQMWKMGQNSDHKFLSNSDNQRLVLKEFDENLVIVKIWIKNLHHKR
jgi:hypothetical protein